MKPSRRFTYFSFSSTSTTTTTTATLTETPPQGTEEKPLQSPHSNHELPTHLPLSDAGAATKIQSVYRAHIIRNLYKIISSVNFQADELQRQIQRQETVDAIRGSEKEKMRMNEALMRLLLRLDSVPGIDPTVREARRKVSRRIVGLQEIVDAICEAEEWDPLRELNWDELEVEVCRESGGEEMERLCAEYLGLRCLERFLRHP